MIAHIVAASPILINEVAIAIELFGAFQFHQSAIFPFTVSHFATAELNTCVLKNAPLVFSITC